VIFIDRGNLVGELFGNFINFLLQSSSFGFKTFSCRGKIGLKRLNSLFVVFLLELLISLQFFDLFIERINGLEMLLDFVSQFLDLLIPAQDGV
jgi:hypothetical protein